MGFAKAGSVLRSHPQHGHRSRSSGEEERGVARDPRSAAAVASGKRVLLSKTLRLWLMFQSPLQEVGLHIFKALNWSGRHLGFGFQGKHMSEL